MAATVPLFRRVEAATAADVSLKPVALKALIASVDAAGAVKRDGSAYAIDLETLAQIAPANISLITAAVQRANSDPLANHPAITAAAAAADAPSVADQIGKVGAALQKAPNIISDIQTLIAETSVATHWWGPTLTLTRAAATALASVSSVDLIPVLGGITIFVPAAAATVAVVVAVGNALGGWIKSVDQGKGVEINLYMWLVPWVAGV